MLSVFASSGPPSAPLTAGRQRVAAVSKLLPLLLLALLTLPLYYELGRNPVQLWDESRLAVNAAEMARDGHWLVPHFDGSPDHWNTKPPLLIWLQALSFKLFGLSTWALRLPTLLATLGTCWVLLRFAGRTLGRPAAGWCGIAVLATCMGYVRLHMARTGDYDALLSLWQVVLWTRFYEYLETGHRRHLAWVGAALLAATLTKGVAGLLGLPGLLLYAVGRGKLLWLLRQPGVYVVAGSWLAVMATYFMVREAVDAGYWHAVQANELGGRYLAVLEEHRAPWSYYLTNLTERFFSPWLWALALALLLGGLQPAGPTRRAIGLLLAFTVGWLLVISTAQTKLEWYDAPIYPALALLTGIGLSILYQDLRTLYSTRLGPSANWILAAGLFGIVFYGAYAATINQLVAERHSDFGAGPNGYLGRYLSLVSREAPQLNNLLLLTDNRYHAVLQYYRMQFEQQPTRHLAIGSGRQVRQLAAGTVVVLCDPAYRASIDSVFRAVELHRDEDGPCQTLLLLAPQLPPWASKASNP